MTGEPVELSAETTRRLELLFGPGDREQARQLLISECGSNLPLIRDSTPTGLERLRFAALKVSDGRIDKLKEAVELAKADWRDLLVRADFAHDPKAHKAGLA